MANLEAGMVRDQSIIIINLENSRCILQDFLIFRDIVRIPGSSSHYCILILTSNVNQPARVC